MNPAEPDPQTPTSPIAFVAVEGLHGKLDYHVSVLGAASPKTAAPLFAVNEERLALLYGSNGTGKTTLLRMLFDALSPSDDRGHRTSLARVRFRRFEIGFANGDSVRYERSDAVAGGFLATAKVSGEDHVWEWDPEREAGSTYFEFTGEFGRTFRIGEPPPGKAGFLRALEHFDVNPVFLTDSRVLVSDVVQPGNSVGEPIYNAIAQSARTVDQLVQKESNEDVRDALTRVRDYLRQIVFAAAQRGSERTDTIYADVAEAIVEHASRVGRRRKDTIPNLRVRVEELGMRATAFTRFALIPEPPAAALIEALDKAQPGVGPVLRDVLTPYLDGLSQRMDELQPGLNAMAGYVDAVSTFLTPKLFDFRLATGAQIVDSVTGERLDPAGLSSGEKQILVLFSDVVALRERTRLFIIDEPELSLNPEWQRQLMPALLQSTDGTPMQLVAATHSIEIMAKYRERLRQLA